MMSSLIGFILSALFALTVLALIVWCGWYLIKEFRDL